LRPDGAGDEGDVLTGAFGTEPMVTLAAGSSRLDVALLGATPVRWQVDLPDGPADLLDGYRDDDELRTQNGVRNGVMAPFCNRVRDGRYVFDGVEHDLLPGSEDRTVYHGLTRTLPFVVRDVVREPDRVRVTLVCAALCGEPAVGYPFAVEVDVTYDLRPDSLSVRIGGTNRGASAAPFSAGWHPYFRLPGAPVIDDLHLSVGATRPVRTGGDLIPLPGDQAAGDVRPGGHHWAPLGDAVIDEAYDLLTDGDPAAELTHPGSGARLVLSQERGLVHLFTGDTLARDPRSSVAIEPVEVMTDAFNRPDCADAIRLEPGARREFAFTVSVT
jgi:aldose 1-epimerase